MDGWIEKKKDKLEGEKEKGRKEGGGRRKGGREREKRIITSVTPKIIKV